MLIAYLYPCCSQQNSTRRSTTVKRPRRNNPIYGQVERASYSINKRIHGPGVPKIIRDGELGQPLKIIGIHSNAEVAYKIKGLGFKKLKYALGIDENVNNNTDGVRVQTYLGKYKKVGEIPPTMTKTEIFNSNTFEWAQKADNIVEKGKEAVQNELGVEGYEVVQISVDKRKDDSSDQLLIADARLFNGLELLINAPKSKDIENNTLKEIKTISQAEAHVKQN